MVLSMVYPNVYVLTVISSLSDSSTVVYILTMVSSFSHSPHFYFHVIFISPYSAVRVKTYEFVNILGRNDLLTALINY